MLLPSILQILAEKHVQSRVVESAESGFKAEMTAAVEAISETERIETGISTEAGIPRPAGVEPTFQEKPAAGQGFEELLRIINKFQKPNPRRVVDVFE